MKNKNKRINKIKQLVWVVFRVEGMNYLGLTTQSHLSYFLRKVKRDFKNKKIEFIKIGGKNESEDDSLN